MVEKKNKRKRKRGADFHCDYTKNSLVMMLKKIKNSLPSNNSSKQKIYKYLQSVNQLPQSKEKIGRKCKARVRKRKSEPVEDKPIVIEPPESDSDTLVDMVKDDETLGSGIKKSFHKNSFSNVTI